MKKLSVMFLLLSIFLLNNIVQAQENLTPKTFVEKIKTTPNAQLLDVRTPNEWSVGKISSSKCMNFMETDFKEQIEKLDKNKAVFVFCAAGGRSTKAAKMLKEAGFKVVYNLQGGGYADLAKEGVK